MTVDASVNDATETFLQHLNGEALTDLGNRLETDRVPARAAYIGSIERLRA